jgi:hypothetical protein
MTTFLTPSVVQGSILKKETLIIKKTSGPALFRALDLRPVNNSLTLKARETRLLPITLPVMDVNPIPAFGAKDHPCWVI